VTAAEQRTTFAGWAVVELMGHRRLAGRVSEATIAGAPFLRLDVPSDPPVTQFYAAAAIYAITPTTEDLAREFAARNRPAPVHAFELPRVQLSPPEAQRPEVGHQHVIVDAVDARSEDDGGDQW